MADTKQKALNRSYLHDGQVIGPYDEPREVPAYIAERDAQLDGDVEPDTEEEEVLGVTFDGNFPKGFPHVDRLKEAGVQSFQALLEIEDYTDLDRIGSAYAEDIEHAVEQTKRVQDETRKSSE